MKWYLELSLCLIGGLLFVFYIRQGYGYSNPNLIANLIFGLLMGSAAYGGLYESQRRRKLKKMPPEQLKAFESMEKKHHRILWYLIIGLVIFCIVIILIAIIARILLN